MVRYIYTPVRTRLDEPAPFLPLCCTLPLPTLQFTLPSFAAPAGLTKLGIEDDEDGSTKIIYIKEEKKAADACVDDDSDREELVEQGEVDGARLSGLFVCFLLLARYG